VFVEFGEEIYVDLRIKRNENRIFLYEEKYVDR